MTKEGEMAKERKTRYKWTKDLASGSWVSKVGSVVRRPWGEFNGFPYCLRNKAPDAYNHMVHRPKGHILEYRSETIHFTTLVTCQLAVEKADRDWKRKKEQDATQSV